MENKANANTVPEPSNSETLKRFLGYIKPYQFLFVVAIIGMVGYALIDVYVLSQIEPLVDSSLTNGNFDFLKLASYFIVPIFVLRGVFNFMGSYTLEYIGTKVIMKMRQQLFEKFIHLPVEFHDTYSSGSLISKIIYDTEQVRRAAGKALLTLVREGMFVIGLIVAMFIASWKLSIIFLLIAPIVALIVSVVSKRFRKVSKAIQKAMGSLTSNVEEAIKGHKVVLMSDAQILEGERFAHKNNQNRLQNMKLASAQILSVSTIQIIASIALAFVLFVASMPSMVEELTIGIFVKVLVFMVMLLKPLKALTTVNTHFQKGMTACVSIFEMLDHPDEKNDGHLKIERAKGKINFKDVVFTYPSKQTPALRNINFEVQAGDTVALVGRSGSGKSTISKLLTRFYDIDSGSIELDDIKISDFTLQSLRRQFALVSQDVVLFNDTIANNIAYGRTDRVSRDEIERAASIAHVSDFVEQLEHGYDSQVGENGVMLSGGQRQRIAIARAILADTPILILDEATSALDTESEKYIQTALDELQKTRTSIVVAHRLSTIEKADLILVIEQGEIIEAGTHQSLLAKNGMYQSLYDMQFSSEKGNN